MKTDWCRINLVANTNPASFHPNLIVDLFPKSYESDKDENQGKVRTNKDC